MCSSSQNEKKRGKERKEKVIYIYLLITLLLPLGDQVRISVVVLQ